jgi:hypothetical protein
MGWIIVCFALVSSCSALDAIHRDVSAIRESIDGMPATETEYRQIMDKLTGLADSPNTKEGAHE